MPARSLVAFLRGDPPPPQGDEDDLCFDPAQQGIIDQLAMALRSTEPMLLILSGPTDSGRSAAVRAAAAAAGRRLAIVDGRELAWTADLDGRLDELAVEVALTGAVAFITDVDELTRRTGEGSSDAARLSRLVDHLPGTLVLTTGLGGDPVRLARSSLRLEWRVPEVATRRALWRRFGTGHPGIGDADIDHIAMRYRLGPGTMKRAIRIAITLAPGRDGGLSGEALATGIRSNLNESFAGLADRIEVHQDWNDVILAEDIHDQVRALIARIRHAHRVYEEWAFRGKVARGLGAPVLFSGPPGTGKTLVAGLIARELDMDLYQVDLSKIVSKWVGETEKQLARVFDAAEAGHALLLFDEADALFARRTEVKAANDRYANLEVNYLLQRVEAFDGIAILTTNLETSIDPALKRRLAAHVVFWPPDQHEREQIWRRILDTGSAPLAGDIDFDELAARFSDMTGANIRNAVLAAAFLAAAEGAAIDQGILERAARGEYRSMGRVVH